jgi:tetratricopeptide (TPR) repeat protein
MRDLWEVPTTDFLEESRPLVVGHPYQAFLQSYAQDFRQMPGALSKQLLDLPLEDVELSQLDLVMLIHSLDKQRGQQLSQMATAHRDDVVRDLALSVRLGDPKTKAQEARRWLEVSPHSPLARAAVIVHDWPFALRHVDAWEKEHPDHPSLLHALAQRYLEQGRHKEAQRYLQRFIARSPDASAYRELADIYKAQGNWDKWKEALDAFLEQEDYGLSHAQVRVMIARHFMARKEWDKARPYAVAAAETWAAWATLCAHECFEGSGDLDNAELWLRRVAERYPDGRLQYLFWCVIRRHANVEKAQKLALEFVPVLKQRGDKDSLITGGAVLLLAGQREEALAVLQKAAEQKSAAARMMVALVAGEMKKDKLRDEAWEKNASAKTDMGPVAGIFLECATQAKKLDLEAMDALLKKIAKNGKVEDLCYYVACFLQQEGRTKEARTYLERCLAVPSGHMVFQALARKMLDETRTDAEKADGKPERRR